LLANVFPEIFRENHFSVFLAVLDEFLLTSVQVWEKNSDLKNVDKIVDNRCVRIGHNYRKAGTNGNQCVAVSGIKANLQWQLLVTNVTHWY
jgi:hypothetical protein